MKQKRSCIFYKSAVVVGIIESRPPDIQALKTLRTAEFKPYVIYVRPCIVDSKRKQLGSSSALSAGITVSYITLPESLLTKKCLSVLHLVADSDGS